MAHDDKDATHRWHFTYIPKKKLASLEAKAVKPYLKKWGLSGRIQSQTFAFNGAVEDFQIQDLLQEFFTSTEVYPYLTCDPRHPIRQPLAKLSLVKVPCTLTDLQIFERLTDPKNGIVFGGNMMDTKKDPKKTDGIDGASQLKQCLQRDIDGFLISDELRKILLDPDENADLFSISEKDEFLFRLFKHLCLGGLWCQYEDTVEPYLMATRELYKDLISVVKTTNDQLIVRSRVYAVVAGTEDCDVATFPRDPNRENNFAYVIVHVDKKYVTTFTHQAGWGDEK